MNRIFFVTTEAVKPEGYYVGAATQGDAQTAGAKQLTYDQSAVEVEEVPGQLTDQSGVLPVWDMNCFLCGAPFRTTHDPRKVPPACDSCRVARTGKRLDGNDL